MSYSVCACVTCCSISMRKNGVLQAILNSKRIAMKDSLPLHAMTFTRASNKTDSRLIFDRGLCCSFEGLLKVYKYFNKNIVFIFITLILLSIMNVISFFIISITDKTTYRN